MMEISVGGEVSLSYWRGFDGDRKRGTVSKGKILYGNNWR